MAVSLYPHQFEAIKKMHNGCILKGDVGTGKSITALSYWYIKVCGGMPKMPGIEYHPMQNPMDIYIMTTAKKRDKQDWQLEAGKLGVNRESNENGVQLHVDSWNNITNYADVTDAFFIFDEQRLVGSGSWVKAFLKIAKNNRWIMLSATPGDNWMDYIPVFVANGFYKNRTEFIRRHVVFNQFSKFAKVERYTEQFLLNSLRDEILVDMPYERHTARHVANVLVDYDSDLYAATQKDRWHFLEERPIKDVAELFALLRRLVNTDISRLGELMKLMEKHPRLIVFYNFNYELDMLRILARTLGYPVAEWNGQKHQEIPDTDKWLYLVQYTAGAEGWNCVTTNAMVFWSLNYSYKIYHQSQGRIDRLNTPFIDLYYYVLRSASTIDTGIWKSLMGKKKFNELDFIKATLEKTWEEMEREERMDYPSAA